MERISYPEVPKGMFDKMLAVEEYIDNSPLSLFLMEMVRLRVAQINGCAYCVDQHHKELNNLGEIELRLSSLCVWEETPYYSEKERAVLSFTEALTKVSEGPISADIYNPLTDYFSKEEIAYLTLAISQINTWTRLMKTFNFTPGNYRVRDKAEAARV